MERDKKLILDVQNAIEFYRGALGEKEWIKASEAELYSCSFFHYQAIARFRVKLGGLN